MPGGEMGRWRKTTKRKDGIVIVEVGWLNTDVPDIISVFRDRPDGAGYTITVRSFRSVPTLEPYILKNHWDLVEAMIERASTRKIVKRIRIEVKEPYAKTTGTKAYRDAADAVLKKAAKQGIAYAVSRLQLK